MSAHEPTAAPATTEPTPSQPSLTPSGRRPADELEVVAIVLEVVGVVLNRPAGAIDARHSFVELGCTSLMAADVARRLSTALGLDVPPTLGFDYPTPASAGEHLWRLLEAPSAAQPRDAAGSKRAWVEAGKVSAVEPIAVVGVGVCLPGGVGSAGELWELLCRGGEGLGPFPRDRGWDVEGLFDPDPSVPGKSYVRLGHFVASAGHFDAGFFGISPREALAMDPQQRLVLQEAWHAFEDAGIDPGSLAGSDTGVFLGVANHDYAYRDHRTVPQELEGYFGIGTAGSVASGRVAYSFGLQGPAVTVDTACSSGLVAVHQAVGALRSGECSLALAGGATVIANPHVFTEFSRQRGLAVDGRCKSFGEGADGTAWGEGVALVVLERLSDAVAGGRRVYGLVEGSAVNQDGASNGLSAPNGPAQERVIRAALAAAGVGAADVDLVEGHGTGTVLGDPIEVQAVAATYGMRGPEVGPVWLGSVKSNIGHTQAAAGVVGLVKVLLALGWGWMPASLHAEVPSRHVVWPDSLRVVGQGRAWPGGDRVRRAGVSAFGISGTNAHVVVREVVPGDGAVPAVEGSGRTGLRGPVDSGVPVAWPVSGRSVGSVEALVGRLRDLESSGLSVTQVAASLAGRAVHDVRGVLVGSSWAEMVAADPAFSRVRRGGRTVFVFPGQGSQWPGMARQLYDADLRFRGALDEVLEHVDTARDAEPLADLMWDPDGEARLRLTENAQPALFAVEAALARWLIDVGVEPHIVIGHSVGEIAAAHAAGVLDLRDASRLVVARGRAMCEVEERGAMAFAALGEDEAVDVLREHPDLELAAVNGPGSVVLAGAATALDAALAALAARGIHGRHLNVSHAFHTRHMRAAAVALAPIAQGVTYRPPTRRMILACSGADADDATIWPRYWCDQMVVPVRFAAALDAAGDPASLCFVEVGPGRALTALTRRRVTEPSRATALLGDGRSGEFEMTRHSLGDLWRHGASVDWTRVNPQAPSVPLPPYPFDGERYWLTSGLTPLATSAERGPGPSSDTDSQDDELPAGATGGVVLSAALDLTDAADCRDLVLKTCAQVLGHRDHGGINPVLGLLEQGFDSLMALELQARLVATSGLSVTPDILTTLTTPADIAEHVLMLARRDWRRRGQAPTSALGLGRDTTGQAAADRSLPIAAPRRKAPQTAGEGELARSFLDARGDDDILDAIEAMCAAAEDAPYFESPAAAPRVSTVRLRPDRDGPVLVLLPSFLPGSGAHQFARLATAVPQGLRLEALPLPGLRPGEELPGSWDALLGALAPAVMEASRGAGVVLGGFSVGGVIAHALAAHLEGQGALVDGVLLLDTYEPLGAAARRGFGEAMRHLLDMPRELVPMEDARLIATGCYVAILQEWRPGRIEAPTLLVRASNPLRGAEPWSRADETTTVPGDHFDLVAEGSAPVGAVVGDWLARLGVLALDRAGGHP